MATLIKTTYYVAMIIHKITYGRLEYDIETKYPKLLVANKQSYISCSCYTLNEVGRRHCSTY